MEHIGRQVGVALVVHPPAPAAVVMLLVVDALQGYADHLSQLLAQFGPLQPHLLQGLPSHDVGQEAADGLLHTFVGIVFQVVECVLGRGRQGAIQLHSESSLAGVEGAR